MQPLRLTLALSILAGCSLIVDGGRGPDQGLDAHLVDSHTHDVGNDQSDTDHLEADGAPAFDASVIVDSEIQTDSEPDSSMMSDTGPEDMMAPDAIIPDAAPSPPPCENDTDCGDARRCVDGACDELICNGCREQQLCVQGCCQAAPPPEDQGSCLNPTPMMLGVSLFDDNSEARRWTNEAEPSCARIGSAETFGVFIPEETDIYCINVPDPDSFAALFLQLNCCDAELACDAASFLDRRTSIERQLYAGVAYLIGYENRRRGQDPSGGPVINQGVCTCETVNDCDIVHLCVDGRCQDRRDQPCGDDAPCGRRAVCTPPPESICAEDV